MTYFPVQSPFELFTDTAGDPLESGYIYIGEANQNPITTPVPIYWDSAGLYLAAQPVRTIGGYPDHNGTPGKIFVSTTINEDYSILVENKRGETVYYLPEAIKSSIQGGASIDTISDLRLLASGTNAAYVRGHTSIGDGGAGYFEWTDGAAPGTYVDNNGTIIVPTGGDGSGAWLRQFDGFMSVAFFGAVGDGVTDDTTAIQNCIDTTTPGSGMQTILFPKTTSYYRVTDTLSIGRWNIDGSGNVLGPIGAKFGLKLLGESGSYFPSSYSGAIRWDGIDLPGANKITQSDSIGTYDFVTDAGALIHIVNGRHIRFENLKLVATNEADDASAYSVIHVEGNSQGIDLKSVILEGGNGPQYRNGTRWDHETNTVYYGYGNSPYYKANQYNPVAVGGWDLRDHNFEHCEFHDGLTGYSQESEQAILCSIKSAFFDQDSTVTNSNMSINGGSLTIYDTSIVRCSNAGRYNIEHWTGGCKIFVYGVHDESTAKTTPPAGFFRTGTTAQSGVFFKANSLQTSGLIYNRVGGGYFSFDQCELGTFRRDYNGNNKCFLKVLNSQFEYLNFQGDSSANPPTMFVEINNIDRGSLVDDMFTGSEIFIGKIENVYPAEAIFGAYAYIVKSYDDRRSYIYNDGLSQGRSGRYEFQANLSSISSGVATKIFSIDCSLAARAYSIALMASTYDTPGALNSANLAMTIEQLHIAITVNNAGTINGAISSSITATTSTQGSGTMPTSWAVAVVGSELEVRLTQTSGGLAQCDCIGTMTGGSSFGGLMKEKVFIPG